MSTNKSNINLTGKNSSDNYFGDKNREAMLLQVVFVGGLLYALGTYFPSAVVNTTNSIEVRWFWEASLNAGFKITSYISIAEFALVLVPLFMLKMVEKRVLAVSLLSFMALIMMTTGGFGVTIKISGLAFILTPSTNTTSGYLIIFSIICIGIISTLCQSLAKHQYPYILLRLFSGVLLLLLIAVLFSKSFDQKSPYYIVDTARWVEKPAMLLFVILSMLFAILGVLQSYKKISITPLMVILALLIAILIYSNISIIWGPDKDRIYSLLNICKSLLMVFGFSMLLWSSIFAGCVQYTRRIS